MPDFCAPEKKVTSKIQSILALVTFQSAWATQTTRKWRQTFTAVNTIDIFIPFFTDKHGLVFALLDDKEAKLLDLQVFEFVFNISSRVSFNFPLKNIFLSNDLVLFLWEIILGVLTSFFPRNKNNCHSKYKV